MLGDNGPVLPAGRFDAIGGAIGDQLFIYGGTTATGSTSELWAYNLPLQTWGRVQPSSPAPYSSPLRDYGYGTGALLGRHLYSFAQAIDPVSGEPLPGTGQLWRWAPTVGGGSVAGSAPAVGYNSAALAGHTAGIVIGILVGLGNLVVVLMLAQNAGVVTFPDLSFGRKASAAGYYTATSSDAGYTAPPA